MEPKIIYHYVGSTRNYGDMAIERSMRRLLSLKSRHPLEFRPIQLKYPIPITEDHVRLINDTGDMLLVGGGGLLMRGDGFSTQSGWQFNINRKNLHGLEVPLVLYGIGYNRFPGELDFSEEAKEHIFETWEKATLTSVRNRGTQQELKMMGVEEKTIIPDPAMFLEPYKIIIPEIHNKFCVGLNLAGDRIDRRFGGTMKDDLRKLAYEINQFLLDLKFRDRESYKVVYIPHVHEYDSHLSYFLKGEFHDKFFDLSKELPWLYPEQSLNVPIIAGIYAQMDVVVGMRAHSNIIPYGQKVPVIGYGMHDKIRYFSQQVGTHVVGNNCSGLKERLKYETTKADRVVQAIKLRYLYKDIDNFNTKVCNVLSH